LRRFAAFNNLRVITDADLKDLGVTVYEALSAIDCLITDISSVWIDFLLLDKPILFAFPDIEAYRLGRGINLEPYEAWVPGPLIRTAAELIQHMSRVASGADDSAELRNAMLSRFHAHQDSHSAGRLLDLIGLPTGVDQQAHDDPRKPVERR
jgi:CDP-glycerol glycerophosphotransferase (TagB/SpsB family)